MKSLNKLLIALLMMSPAATLAGPTTGNNLDNGTLTIALMSNGGKELRADWGVGSRPDADELGDYVYISPYNTFFIVSGYDSASGNTFTCVATESRSTGYWSMYERITQFGEGRRITVTSDASGYCNATYVTIDIRK